MIYKPVADSQNSKGRIFVFDKKDPGVKSLRMGDVIATKNGMWKLLDWTVATFHYKTKSTEDYVAYYVKEL